MSKPKKRARRAPRIRLLTVSDSVNIHAVGYDRASKLLRVRFRDGSEYDYHDVSSSTYAQLVGAPSIGVHFAEQIRHKYKTERRRRPRTAAHAS